MPITGTEVASNLEPVRFISPQDQARQPRVGIALCLSGGGYRAMLFHLGYFIAA